MKSRLCEDVLSNLPAAAFLSYLSNTDQVYPLISMLVTQRKGTFAYKYILYAYNFFLTAHNWQK